MVYSFFLKDHILLQECSNMKSLLWIWSVPLVNSISSMFVRSWEEEDLYTWRLLGQEERGMELELYRKLSLIISLFLVWSSAVLIYKHCFIYWPCKVFPDNSKVEWVFPFLSPNISQSTHEMYFLTFVDIICICMCCLPSWIVRLCDQRLRHHTSLWDSQN